MEVCMEFLFEHEVDLNLIEALPKVKASLKSNGFGTLFELNFKTKFEEHGLSYPNDYYVLEVCNPKLARQILDVSETIGYFLPCKVVVRSNGNKTVIGMIKPAVLLHMVTDDPMAKKIATEVETIIRQSIMDI